MNKSDGFFVFRIYFFWLIGIFVALYLFSKLIPLQVNFLGGGVDNYLNNPFLWAWVNFDGEHYLSLAQVWYQPLTYFFFPLYPLIVRAVSILGGFRSPGFLAIAGIAVSHISLVAALIGLVKLIKLDFKKISARLALILLLLFPTSFYFGAVYTESLFIALSIWSFYFARQGKFLPAGVFSALATGTRVIGVILPLVLLIEFFAQKKSVLNFKNLLGLIISPLGILIYMLYLNNATGSPLEFFNNVGIFGEQRQSALILLPQVFYRYFFKIIPNINFDYFPVVFTTSLEVLAAVFFLMIIVFSFRKLPFSYWVFLVLGYFIPTFSGSFSSLPRYVLVLFPAFIYLSAFLKDRKFLLFAFIALSTILLVISLSMFARGYWIS